MKKIIRYTLVSALLSFCGTASAQNLNSAYFLDGFTYVSNLDGKKIPIIQDGCHGLEMGEIRVY